MRELLDPIFRSEQHKFKKVSFFGERIFSIDKPNKYTNDV